jgi:hypothetical protein
LATTYCNTEQVAAQLGISDTDDDLLIDGAISAASRQIDAFCGRRFYQDSAVATREFYAASNMCLDLLDQPGESPATEISTTTGLIVKTDTGDDGTFATTLTINTDFILLPRNADDDSRPWNEIHLLTTYFPSTSYGRAHCQITAKFGWATIPDEVEKACIIQATQLYKSKDAVFGVAGVNEFGPMRVGGGMDKIAAALLKQHQIVPVG